MIPAPRQSKPTPAAPSSFDDDAPLNGADLQIDLSGAKPAAGLARPPTPGVGFSPFDDDISAGPSLELDVEGGGLPPRIASPSVPSVPVPPPPVSHRTPFVELPAAAGVTVDPFEAKVLADYGPVPEAFWQAPMYAYRVMSRRGELRRALAERREDATRTSKRVEDALVAFGEKARVTVKEGALTPLLERVKAAEDLLRSRDSALAGTMDAQRAALAAIDARLGPAQTELAQATALENQAVAARDAADADSKRAEAKVKRIDIELRNLGAAPPAAPKAGADREAAADEAAAQAAKLAAAERAVTEAHRKTAAATARCDTIGAERTAEEQRFTRQTGTRGAGVDDAHQQLRAALAELGRALLADKSMTELAAARDEVARLEQTAHAKTKSVAVHESALTAYDAPKVFLGMALVAIGVALVVVVILFPYIYRALGS